MNDRTARQLIPTYFTYPLSCTKTIKLTIPPELCDRLDEIARDHCSSRLNLIRHAIQIYVAAEDNHSS